MQRQRTKIVATLGPATDPAGVLRECLLAGMDVARLNAAHGTGDEQRRRVVALRKEAQNLGLPAGLLVDLPGPKFRLGSLPGGQRELQRGETVTLSVAKDRGENVLPIRDTGILSAVEHGHRLHLADGTVTLRVLKRAGAPVKGEVIVGGLVRSGSGINVPDTDVHIKIPTAMDLRGIEFAAAHKAEWIGVSFVRTPDDIARVRRAFSRSGHTPKIIAKIEKPQALANLDLVLREADGLMVARGDLGVETPLAQVPLGQKKIIGRANAMGKPVITATQMLESMVSQRWPTRAEVTDVANAVLDGTDAVMLSAETAIGKYPVDAIRMLGSVLAATETAYPFQAVLDTRTQKAQPSPEDAVSRAACRLAWDADAAAIILSADTDVLPYSVSRFRPPKPIVVLTDHPMIVRQLALSWGVQPVFAPRHATASLEPARRWLLQNGLARRGNPVVWIQSIRRRKEDVKHSIQLATL